MVIQYSAAWKRAARICAATATMNAAMKIAVAMR